MQTPYAYPQEYGHRRDVRWAGITANGNAGLRVEGDPLFGLTVRGWTSEQLDATRHPTDLRPTDRTWINLDHAVHGAGSASCGPGVLERHRLRPVPASLRLVLTAMSRGLPPQQTLVPLRRRKLENGRRSAVISDCYAETAAVVAPVSARRSPVAWACPAGAT